MPNIPNHACAHPMEFGMLGLELWFGILQRTRRAPDLSFYGAQGHSHQGFCFALIHPRETAESQDWSGYTEKPQQCSLPALLYAQHNLCPSSTTKPPLVKLQAQHWSSASWQCPFKENKRQPNILWTFQPTCPSSGRRHACQELAHIRKLCSKHYAYVTIT